MRRLLVLAVLACGFLGSRPVLAADKEEAKEALKALQDYIGEWKGSGQPQKGPLWKETVNWGWRFKGNDSWLTVEFKGSKTYKGGEVRYLADKERYQLTLTDAADKKLVFLGELKNNYLTFERTDPASKEVQRLIMNIAGDGARFIYRVERKAQGTTLWKKEYLVACTKEGESLGAKEKKQECVVSGGLGTMPVTYKGETFYVCCSGCRDAFNENPEKYIKEFRAKKKK